MRQSPQTEIKMLLTEGGYSEKWLADIREYQKKHSKLKQSYENTNVERAEDIAKRIFGRRKTA